MSEMEWEGAPGVHTPLVRPFAGKALADWTRGCYPPQRGGFFVWGFFFWVWAIWEFLKLMIYLSGVALIIVAIPVWIAAELITYRHRVKRDALRAWGPYVREQAVDPPEAA